MRFAVSGALLLACYSIAPAASPAVAATAAAVVPQVHVVRCPANEQQGPARPQAGESMPAPVKPSVAARIAYYEAAGSPGIFAPRGWSCRAWNGSSGSVLLVTPKRIQPPYFPLPMLTGPAVTIATSDGSTSGRFHVAIVAAQLFPVVGSGFITRVRQEHLLPDSTFDTQSYPEDQLSYLSDRFVQYTTPPNHTGVGTDDLLQPSDLPIRGLSILTLDSRADSLTEVRLRLPVAMNAAAAAILQLETACVQLPRGCRGLR